jgi:hypothetical protein
MIVTPLFVCVNYHLCVGARPKLMAKPFKLTSQNEMVVNLSVENDPDGLIFIAHWISTLCGEVNDREPPVRKPNTVVSPNPYTFIIRPAMRYCSRHRHKFCRANAQIARHAGYSAH